MSILKNNYISALCSEGGIKSKTQGLGTENVEKASETNIVGVTENILSYNSCAEVLRAYKEQLDIDATRVRDLGTVFFEMDHDGIHLH